MSPSACHSGSAVSAGSATGPPLEFGAYTGSETLTTRIAPSLE